MITYKDIKTQIYQALDDYSSNGRVNERVNNMSADLDLRLPAAVDSVQKRCALTNPLVKLDEGELAGIDESTPDDHEIRLKEIARDALIYGAASQICPISQPALYVRLRSLYEEAMGNMYNAFAIGAGVRNNMYGWGGRG